MAILILILLYLICAFLCFGLFNAHSQARFPNLSGVDAIEEYALSIFMAIFFASALFIGVIATFFITGLGKCGFKLKPFPKGKL